MLNLIDILRGASKPTTAAPAKKAETVVPRVEVKREEPKEEVSLKITYFFCLFHAKTRSLEYLTHFYPTKVFLPELSPQDVPPLLKHFSWTRAAPFKEEKHHRAVSDTIGNNYSPWAADLSVKVLGKRPGVSEKGVGELDCQFSRWRIVSLTRFY